MSVTNNNEFQVDEVTASDIIGFDELRERVQPYIDVPVTGVGTMRIAKIGVSGKLKMQREIAELPQSEDGTRAIETPETIEYFVKLICRMLRGPDGKPQYDNEGGYDLIDSLGDEAFADLTRAILKQAGIGSGGEEEQAEVIEELDKAKNG